ncbi:MAG: hypothetical protein N3H30_01530 [Candidatus Micrarchaeota archaeon]|nr:hypothetical protein [Candidatus Micrarchaeota archaeon]
MANEEIHIEKRILCQKCGHVHDFSIKTSLSVANFVFDTHCISCGAPITVDRTTIFKNSLMSTGATLTSTSQVLDISPANAQEGSSATIMSDVTSFFDELDKKIEPHESIKNIFDEEGF